MTENGFFRIIKSLIISESFYKGRSVMNIKPLHDWAVIVPSAAEEISAGGLYIPETAKSKPQEGVVEAIGPGAFEEEKRQKKTGEKKERRFIPTVVKPGDRVLYERYAGQTYRMNDEERILVRERDILGILPEGSSRPRPAQIPATTTSSGPTLPAVAGPAPLRGKKTAMAVTRGKAPAKAALEKTVKKAVKKKTVTKKVAPAKPAPKPKGKASGKKKR